MVDVPQAGTVMFVTSPSTDRPPPHDRRSAAACRRGRDAEVALLKLMVDKLKLQLLRDASARSSARSSEQLDDPQAHLIEPAPLYEHRGAPRLRRSRRCQQRGHRSQPARPPAARERSVHRPADDRRAHDAPARPVVAPPAVVDCARSARMSPNSWSTCRRASRSSAMCGPKLACVQLPGDLPGSRHRAGRSRAAWPARACWPM